MVYSFRLYPAFDRYDHVIRIPSVADLFFFIKEEIQFGYLIDVNQSKFEQGKVGFLAGFLLSGFN